VRYGFSDGASLRGERTIGGWCGCAALWPFPVAFMIALEDATHGLSGIEWLGFWVAAVAIPILIFQCVKWIVNGTSRLLCRRVNTEGTASEPLPTPARQES
jgi:hypothetical protein